MSVVGWAPAVAGGRGPACLASSSQARARAAGPVCARLGAAVPAHRGSVWSGRAGAEAGAEGGLGGQGVLAAGRGYLAARRAMRTRCVSRGAVAPELVAPVVPGKSTVVPGDKVLVFGATGYIGRFVVKELVDRGYKVVAVVRKESKTDWEELAGAELRVGDVSSLESLRNDVYGSDADIKGVVSCMASRSGAPDDAWKVDYQATKDAFDVAVEKGAKHFVLLSAICVRSARNQEPGALQFQYAKAKVEDHMVAVCNEGPMVFSSVQPTAFFKSITGQFENVRKGGAFVMFGDGKLTTCNAISEPELAAYLANCFLDPGLHNRILPVGGPAGPDNMVTPLDQANMIHEVLGREEVKTTSAPVALFDVIINTLQFLGDVQAKIMGTADDKDTYTSLQSAAELARIGKYYGVEDMLTTDPSQQFGRTTVRMHYEAAKLKGEAFDPNLNIMSNLSRVLKSKKEEGVGTK